MCLECQLLLGGGLSNLTDIFQMGWNHQLAWLLYEDRIVTIKGGTDTGEVLGVRESVKQANWAVKTSCLGYTTQWYMKY